MTSALDEINFRTLASNLGKEWKHLATHLGVRRDEMERIQADNGTVEEQIFQMLLTWWQRWDHQTDHGGGRAQDFLCDALANSGRTDLKESLQGTLELTHFYSNSEDC